MNKYIEDYWTLEDGFLDLSDMLTHRDIFAEAKETVFHIGYDTEDICSTLVCKRCGSQEFNVGTASYYTGIKCIKCGMESCVHEG